VPRGALPSKMPRKIQFIGTKISNLSVSLRHVDTRTARRASLRISPSLEHPQASGSTTALEEWENEMVPLIGSRCVYDPEVLIVMTNAFDRACDFLPAEFRDSDHMRRKLALHIIRQVDDGESDSARLADSAILSLRRWPIRGARRRIR